MKNVLFFISVGIVMVLVSCQNSSSPVHESKGTLEKSQFIGSWVQPNPINDKEVQGYKFNPDGTAQSINMATLKCEKWWVESDTLVLVLESIGNRVSSTDTIKYEVLQVNDKILRLKSGDYVDEYKRQ